MKEGKVEEEDEENAMERKTGKQKGGGDRKMTKKGEKGKEEG